MKHCNIPMYCKYTRNGFSVHVHAHTYYITVDGSKGNRVCKWKIEVYLVVCEWIAPIRTNIRKIDERKCFQCTFVECIPVYRITFVSGKVWLYSHFCLSACMQNYREMPIKNMTMMWCCWWLIRFWHLN